MGQGVQRSGGSGSPEVAGVGGTASAGGEAVGSG
jgi:hypothetical protein